MCLIFFTILCPRDQMTTLFITSAVFFPTVFEETSDHYFHQVSTEFLTFTIRYYHSSILVGLPDCIQCLHRTYE